MASCLSWTLVLGELMTNAQLKPASGGTRSETEGENDSGITIRVEAVGAGVHTFHTYYHRVGTSELPPAGTLLRLDSITLVGQSASDVSLVYPSAEEGLMAIADTSDSALPQVSKGMVFYGDLSDLEAALDELESISEAAEEDDCLEPTPLAIENADFLVKALYHISPRRYDIYPMSGGEVVIDGGNQGRRIGVFCYPDGRVLYVGWVDDVRQKVSKDGVVDVPHEFLNQALTQLDALEQHEQRLR